MLRLMAAFECGKMIIPFVGTLQPVDQAPLLLSWMFRLV